LTPGTKMPRRHTSTTGQLRSDSTAVRQSDRRETACARDNLSSSSSRLAARLRLRRARLPDTPRLEKVATGRLAKLSQPHFAIEAATVLHSGRQVLSLFEPVGSA